jgi:2-(1,2-epoxy-1,2-dihydrophenyl)acetyl-CoA isomerase
MSSQAEIRVEVSDSGVATVTIDRPARRNALTGQTMTELTAAIRDLAADDALRAIILTGAAGAFCSGIDIDWLTDTPPERIAEQGVSFYDLPQSMVRALIALPVPTLAAVDGPAVGLGLDLALACDCRLIGPDGWLRQGWGGAGLVPATGGVLTLGAVAGTGALWRLLDGQPKIEADRAERFGLGEPGTPTGLAAAGSRAQAFAAMPQTTMRGYVELARAPLRAQLDEHLARAAQIQLSLFAEGRYRAALTAAIAPRRS